MLMSYLQYYLFKNTRIFEAKSEEEKLKIFAFRYKVYHEEYAMVEKYDHEQRILKDSIDDHKQLILTYTTSKNNISSTCRSFYSELGQIFDDLKSKYFLEHIPLVDNQSLGFTERLAINRGKRGRYIIVSQTIYTATRLIRDLETYFSFASCAPGLLRHYMRLGYRPYSNNILQFDDRIEIPIAVMPDLEFLKSMGSPIYPIMKKHCPRAVLDQYENYRPDLLGNYLTQKLSIDDLDMSDISRHKKSFLHHLKIKTLNFLIKNGFFLNITKGQLLFSEKEHYQVHFVVLSGTLVLSKRNVELIKIHPGDIIGELGTHHDNYSRCVSVSALAECRLLVLPRNIARMLSRYDNSLYSNFLESYSKSIALRERKLIVKIIAGK